MTTNWDFEFQTTIDIGHDELKKLIITAVKERTGQTVEDVRFNVTGGSTGRYSSSPTLRSVTVKLGANKTRL